ncbi:ABC transporter permease [Yinghuangia soli]|uniref:FtsX-like permease family protein n=1 Tax=Yinghuangia soli TaxID=2908204 RepID=A0AA41Q4Y2_9ACTN|nr:ABC transporter permease [Yinghuangia soli]MCF2531623.1 FtsX-like permease family protein [Yinghuangia soli]
MNAVLRAAWSAIVRRRVQTLVTAVVALLATATAVLGLGLLVASMGPFDRAFARLNGAHAAVSVDAAKATPEQIQAGAARAGSGITAFGGPYPSVSAVPEPVAGVGNGHVVPEAVTVVGRTSPDGPLDELKMVSGRWVRAPGEIVFADGQNGPTPEVGTRLRLGGVEMTVVGTAASVTGTAGAWALPDQVAAIHGADGSRTFQVLYRFAAADGNDAVAAGVAAVRAGLPADAVLGSTSYLEARRDAAGVADLVVPFVTAFSVLGLVMSVLIVANVVSGSVVAGYRGIGVLKTLGFSPVQVAATYLAQVLLPALFGAALGTVIGQLLALPLLADTAESFAVPEVASIPWWVDVAVPLGLIATVCVAALVPALKAGRTPAVQAIAVGRAPRSGRGFRAHRILSRAPLPRAVGLGLASPFTRPARTAMTLAALLLGTAAVTFAYGLAQTLDRVDAGLSRAANTQVTVDLLRPSGPPGQNQGPLGEGSGPVQNQRPPGVGGPGAGPGGKENLPSADPAAVAAMLRADSGTARFTEVAEARATIPGRTQGVELTGYGTDSSWLGYPILAGRWFQGPGEVVVPTSFLRGSALKVGDEIALEWEGRRTKVRIVGEAFSSEENHLYVDRGTLTALDPASRIEQYEVKLAPGTDIGAYIQRLAESQVFAAGFGGVMDRNESSETLAILLGLIATLTLLLAAVAALGVLNTVALDTRERAQSIGVLKSLGMTPRQTLVMVVTSVTAVGLIAGAIGIPLGVALHHAVAPVMAGVAELRLPDHMLSVYSVPSYAVLAVSGALLAALGALMPATWAAKTKAALWRTE